MFCTHCGNRNGEYDRFCTSCGAKLEEMPANGVNMPLDGAAEGPVDQTVSVREVREPVQDNVDDAKPQTVVEDTSETVQSQPDLPLDTDAAGETDETADEADDFDSIPLQSVADEVVEATQEPTQEPTQGVAAMANASDSVNDAANGKSKSKSKSKISRRGVVVAVVVAVVVLVAAVVAGVVTYRMELWGGRSLPRVSAGSSVSGSAPSARSVAKQLRDKGFEASRRQVFSGERKGAFLGYEGARGGERVRAGQRVVVRESAGPGVPSGTVGRQASVVAGELKDMGVPVRYKQVIVSTSGKVKPGSVVATYPEPGYGVTDTKTGIYVGVAVRSDDGLPADIVGRGVSDVKADLEAKGYTVKTEKRLSSKKYVGKVSGSIPGPGSKLSDGQTVTLYEGVDAKGAKQSFMLKYPEMSNAELAGFSTVAAGRWCTNNGDCITLNADGQNFGSSMLKVTEGGSGKEDGMDDDILISCDAVQQAFCGKKSNDYLLQGDTGAFELFPHHAYDGYWCGSSFIITNSVALQRCKAGVPVDNDLDSDYEDISGGEYRMMNYFMVAPVGTDLKALENKDYFDADALKSASAQKSVDTSRPFLLYRDPKLYKTTTANVDGDSLGKNPFVPMHGDGGKNMVRMKPAPSDATAYYLVESTQPDWDTLADAKVKGATSTGTNTSADAKRGSSATDETTSWLMKQISGKYGFSSGAGGWSTQISVREDGAFSGKYSACALGDVSDEHPNGTCVESEFTGRFIDAKRNDDGSYGMTCDASSLALRKTVGTKRTEKGVEYTAVKPYGIDPCGAFKVYPKGYDSGKLSETVKSWSTAWNDYASSGWPSELETPIIVNMEEDPNGSAEEAFYQSKYLD